MAMGRLQRSLHLSKISLILCSGLPIKHKISKDLSSNPLAFEMSREFSDANILKQYEWKSLDPNSPRIIPGMPLSGGHDADSTRCRCDALGECICGGTVMTE
jgi:hypothetical protein